MQDERPQLIIGGGTPGKPITYVCSRCGRPFPLGEDRTPKEAVAELLAVFKAHVQKEHSDDGDNPNTNR